MKSESAHAPTSVVRQPDGPPARPSVAIHGHFYQPPREDPWFGWVPRQPGAAPFHDWNRKIERECYGPVTAARILDEEGRPRRILNCLEYMSFNFGPTLLSWLEDRAPETYRAILDADLSSRARTGHGGALAMPFHHPILPLSDPRDRVTEVRWGIQDFRRRFGRDPEGMWLPETAVDPESLDVLAQEGIRFTILAPHQMDPLPPGGGAGVYVTPSGAQITLVPYDGAHSHAVAFGDVLRDAEAWTDTLLKDLEGAESKTLQLIATDGETFGHHKTFGEMALAATLERLDRSPDVELVNLGQYLSSNLSAGEVDLVSPTSWSCAHGVGRWREDCGCKLDGSKASQQEWRGPLREAVSWLANQLHRQYETEGSAIFQDPWKLRDEFGEVAGSSDPEEVRDWVRREGRMRADGASIDRAVMLLELERNALRLFTSCGWFFDDLAGVEPVQILRYAARAIDLSRRIGGPLAGTDEGFLNLLDAAMSNDPSAGSGRRVFMEQARPAVPPSALAAAGFAAEVHSRGVSGPIDYGMYAVRAAETAIHVRHRATGVADVYRTGVVEPGRRGTELTVTVIDDQGMEFVVTSAQLPEPAREALGMDLPTEPPPADIGDLIEAPAEAP